jgi:hypothetical protein
LAVVGICLGVYAVFAVGFHWFVEPSIAKAPPATVLPYSDAAVAAATPSAPPPDIAPKPRRSLAIAAAAPNAPEETSDVAKKPARKHVARERSVRERRNPWDFASGRSYGYGSSYGNGSWFR